MSIGIIAAVSEHGVIGLDGRIPWHYSSDLKRFKRVTSGTTIIMGRLTWDSLPKKPLPERRNIVITSGELEGVECFRTIDDALKAASGDVWFIGGARIFAEAMEHADLIDMTFVSDRVETDGAVFFPDIDDSLWEAGPTVQDPDEPSLRRCVYRKKGTTHE